KVNFLKRLESSVSSFASTMARTVEKIETLENKLKEYKAKPNTTTTVDDSEIAQPADAGDDEELADAIEVGSKLSYKLEHMKVEEWLRELQRDKQQLSSLEAQARAVTPDRDKKLQELKGLIGNKIRSGQRDKDGRPNRKLL